MKRDMAPGFDATGGALIVKPSDPELEKLRRWRARCAVAWAVVGAAYPGLSPDDALAKFAADTHTPERLAELRADRDALLELLDLTGQQRMPGECPSCGRTMCMHDAAIGRCQPCARKAQNVRKAAAP